MFNVRFLFIFLLLVQIIFASVYFITLIAMIVAQILALDQQHEQLAQLLAEHSRQHPLGRPWTLPKSTHWYDVILPQLPENIFREHFRINRVHFNVLVNELHPFLVGEPNNFRANIPVRKKVAIGLFRLASSCELRVIAELFGVGKSTVHKIHYEFTAAVIARYSDQVKWPEEEEDLLLCAREFSDFWGYPCCIGSIDGCHIPISPPKNDAIDYYNYKGWYSCVLLGVCDAKYRFTYFHLGTPGKSNDSFIFRHCHLFRKLTNQKNTLVRLGSFLNGALVPLHLIGDSAFPLLETLMKPFPHGVQNLIHRLFNYRLSRTRRVIENAFGRLKARFRIMSKRMELDVGNVNETVSACVLLHNLFEGYGEAVPPHWYGIPFRRIQGPLGANRAAQRSAINIRNAIVQYFADQQDPV